MDKIKFGTGGFRGIIGESFTKKNVQKICQSMANIVKNKKLKQHICIGYDNRFMSEIFAKWCAEVFAKNDITVDLVAAPCATPVIMYQTMKQDNDYGVMITASHNPYMYNGIKVIVKEGKDASVEQTQEIENEFNKISEMHIDDTTGFEKNVKLVNYDNEFVDYIIENQNLSKLSNINVVFDTKFGSTKNEIELFCTKLGIKNYKIINSAHDAFFGFVPPAPNEDNIGALRNEVIQNKADIGFALDADGDRLAVVDKNGKYWDNNTILSLVYYYMIKYENKQGDVIKNCATTSLLDLLANKFGFICHEVPVGFKYISNKLKEVNGVVGGESSGGLAITTHIWGKDSLISIALCLKILSELKMPLNNIIEEMFEFADGYNKTIVDCSIAYSKIKENEIKNVLFYDQLLPNLNYPVAQIVRNDYLKIFYQNGDWVLIRFSGTEPLLRIFAEFDTKEKCENEILLWKNFLKI